jgi:ribonuclease D
MPDPITTELAAAAREHGRLAIDTEFMGEGRYQPLLCLAQVAVETGSGDTREGVRVELLDPIEGGFDHRPLADVMADPSVEIVMHAGRQDVGLLKRVWQTEITNLFDTQIAAGFAGLRAQMGYEALLNELLGVRLAKSASFTRWDSRPLSEEQQTYAAEDVLDLLAAATELQRRLDDLGRLEWAREECRRLEVVSDERIPEALFARLPRVGGSDGRTRAVARELVEWREETAAQADRPPSTVMQDAVLMEVAKRRPKNLERLEQIRGLGQATLHRRGKSLLEAVARGMERDPIPSEGEKPIQGSSEDAPLAALAEALVRTRASEATLAYELVATKADLGRVVAAVRQGLPEPEVRALQGWRREVVGDELLALLRGERTLRVGGDGRLEILEG